MTVEEQIEELKAAIDLMIKHASAGRGGSGGASGVCQDNLGAC